MKIPSISSHSKSISVIEFPDEKPQQTKIINISNPLFKQLEKKVIKEKI